MRSAALWTQPRTSGRPPRQSHRTPLLCFALAAAVLGLLASPAHAHKRNFAWSYEWFVPVVGEKEIEMWITRQDDGGAWQKQLEYEFAASPRHAVGLYATVEDESLGSLRLNGWKLENRYQFGEFDTNRWLHAAYLEVAKQQGEPYELEGKWLLSRYNAHGDALAVNLIAEKELTAGEDVEWGYAAGWSRVAGPRLRAGVESFGQFKDRVHYLGPTVAVDVDPQTRLVLNASKGLTSESDSFVVRLVGEYEF